MIPNCSSSNRRRCFRARSAGADVGTWSNCSRGSSDGHRSASVVANAGTDDGSSSDNFA